ncbi:hypothetical protein D3C71_1128080 [compost metagenome]
MHRHAALLQRSHHSRCLSAQVFHQIETGQLGHCAAGMLLRQHHLQRRPCFLRRHACMVRRPQPDLARGPCRTHGVLHHGHQSVPGFFLQIGHRPATIVQRISRSRHHGTRCRVHRVARQRRRQSQHLFRAPPMGGVYGLQGHAIPRERAGLVEHDSVHMGQRLQPLQVAHQHTMARQRASGGEHGHRRGQRQRAGAGDDEHSYRHHQGMPRVGRPPVHCSQARCHEHRHQKRPRNAIRQLGKAWLLQRRTFHQCHDLREAGLPARAFHMHLHRRLQVVAARRDRAAHGARHGGGLARQQGFIGVRAAQRDAPIGRKRLARQHTDGVARHHAARGHAHKAAIGSAPLHAIR